MKERQAIPQANFNLRVSLWYGKPIADHLSARYGQPYLWNHRPPIGVNQTLEFLKLVAAFALEQGAPIDGDADAAFIRHESDAHY